MEPTKRRHRFNGPAKLALLAATLLPASLAAQQTGRIMGRIVDTSTGGGLSGVTIRVTGTPIATHSGVDGFYLIRSAPAGTAAVSVANLGYAAKTVTGVVITADGVTKLDIALEPSALELATISVSASAERGTVARALDGQRTATGIVNAITAEQISNSPDGDAAAAMRRVSGVTVQDGKHVFLRGLGDRYTTTSLNGARIPSPEPEKKTVPLDLFPSWLLETITTTKTFTPDQPGDFSGGQVNIETKAFPAERTLGLSVSGGFAERSTGRTVLAGPGFGHEWIGLGGGQRELPDMVRQAGDFRDALNQEDIRRMVGAFRNSWSPQRETAAPNGSAAVSAGGTTPLLGRSLSYLLSGTYSRRQGERSNERRAVALAAPDGGTTEIDRYDGSTGSVSVLWGGLANLSTLIGSHSRLILNATYNRTADNEARFETGESEQFAVPLQIQRLRYIERSVFSTQLKGEHEPAAGHRTNWTVSYSGVERGEPDRSEFVYLVQSDPATGEALPPVWYSVSSEGAVRTFAQLEETSVEAMVDHAIEFGDPSRVHTLKLGGALRRTDRDADNRAYSISAIGVDRETGELEPEQIIERLLDRSDVSLRLTPLGAGGSYTAGDELAAAYAMLDVGLGSRVRVVGGARVEHQNVTVRARSTLGDEFLADPAYTDVLPALSVNIALSDEQNLRLSGSQTLARPEYRELAGIRYREVLDGEQIGGNPGLRRTRIQNADVRWEWYPAPSEILSIAVFAKRFDDPIERVYRATSGTRIVEFVNADRAHNYGVELEARKGLGTLTAALDPVTAFANLTLMSSDIEIGSSGAANTSDSRAMVGQAPYVVNAGLTYTPASGLSSATLLYNVVGRRIVSAGELPLPDVYEEARHVADLSLRLAVTSALSAKLDAKNLLDAPYELTQGTVTRSYFETGRSFSIGLSLKR